MTPRGLEWGRSYGSQTPWRQRDWWRLTPGGQGPHVSRQAQGLVSSPRAGRHVLTQSRPQKVMLEEAVLREAVFLGPGSASVALGVLC